MSNGKLNFDGTGTTFWFNTRTAEVEEGPQSLATYRLGPFETRTEAEHATEIIAERARKWAEEEENE